MCGSDPMEVLNLSPYTQNGGDPLDQVSLLSPVFRDFARGQLCPWERTLLSASKIRFLEESKPQETCLLFPKYSLDLQEINTHAPSSVAAFFGNKFFPLSPGH
ncbi:uncharacterized protein ACIBXB_008676 isoform 1-T1 [Morphnus guianensis]